MSVSFRSDNRRKTKYIPDTNTPEWHHTLVFMTQPRKELKKRNLEVTVWNFSRTNPHEHLGEVSVDLSGKNIDTYVCMILIPTIARD
jgi:hypothetical protein